MLTLATCQLSSDESDPCRIDSIFEILEFRWEIFEFLREYAGATRPLPL
jgi:hypothetical protein